MALGLAIGTVGLLCVTGGMVGETLANDSTEAAVVGGSCAGNSCKSKRKLSVTSMKRVRKYY